MTGATSLSRSFVFFDVDYTLVEWTAGWAEAFAQVAGEAGVEVSAEQAWEALRAGSGGIYRECLRKYAPAGEVAEFWLDYNGRLLELLGVSQEVGRHSARVGQLLGRPEAIRLYPEVPQVLAELAAAGVRLGILTGRPVASPDLERLGVRHYFDPVIDAFTAGSAKGEGRMFEMAAQLAAREGWLAWHVGDSYHDDVLGARLAGLKPVLVDRWQAYPEVDCLRVADLRGVPEMVLGEGARV